jgi:hypothetical protein
MPTWVLSIGLVMLSMIALVAGLVLDSVARGRAEQKRLAYLAVPSINAARLARQIGSPVRAAGGSIRAA